jgi:hypothetical protein
MFDAARGTSLPDLHEYFVVIERLGGPTLTASPPKAGSYGTDPVALSQAHRNSRERVVNKAIANSGVKGAVESLLVSRRGNRELLRSASSRLRVMNR